LVLLGDCHYLPYEEGPEAEMLYQMARGLISTDPAVWSHDVTRAFQERATGCAIVAFDWRNCGSDRSSML
jgi:hypothetical protein